MEGKQPYIFNPGMSMTELQTWLERQSLAVSCFNKLVEEKAAIEKRLEEINRYLDFYASRISEEKLSFAQEPSPDLTSK